MNKDFNSTLSEWHENPERNVETDSQLSAIFKEAIYNIEVNAASGYYNFDKRTKQNTNGFTPITYYQARYQTDGSLQKALPVSYYDHNDKTFHSVNGGFLFGRSKKIPIASPIEVEYEVEMVKMSTCIILGIIAALIVSICLVFVAILFGKLKALTVKESVSVRFQTFKWQDMMKIVGLVVFLSSVFATPHGTRGVEITTNYICHSFLLTIGLALITSGTIWKIEKAKCLKKSGIVINKKESKIMVLIWLFVQIGLIVAFIANGPFSRIEIAHLKGHYSDDKNAVFRPFRYQYGPDFLSQSELVSFGLFIAIALSNVLVMLFCIFEAYRTLSMLKLKMAQYRNVKAEIIYSMEDFKMTFVSLVFSFILFCAIALIGVILMSQPDRLVLLASASVIIVSSFIISVEFVPKFKDMSVRASTVKGPGFNAKY